MEHTNASRLKAELTSRLAQRIIPPIKKIVYFNVFRFGLKFGQNYIDITDASVDSQQWWRLPRRFAPSAQNQGGFRNDNLFLKLSELLSEGQ